MCLRRDNQCSGSISSRKTTMETPAHRSYVTLWVEKPQGPDILMALPKFPNGKLWLPFAPFPESGFFSDAFNAVVKKYKFRPTKQPELIIRCFRREQFIWRNVIFKTEIETTDKSVWVKAFDGHLDYDRKELHKFQSSEFLDARSFILSHRIMDVQFFSKPLTEDDERLFESASFTKTRISSLCCILMDMIWPCELFDLDTFRTLLRRLYSDDLRNTKALFRICTVENGCFAEPSQILKLLACLEPSSSGKARFDLIFRMYSDEKRNEMTPRHVEHLIKEVTRGHIDEDISRETRHMYSQLLTRGSVTREQFREALSKSKPEVHRTDTILRAPYSLFCNERIDEIAGEMPANAEKRLRMKDPAVHFGLASHTVRIRATGLPVDPIPWWRIQDANARRMCPNQPMRVRDAAQDSVQRFDSSYAPNALLEELKIYASEKGSKDRFQWNPSKADELAQKFIDVCELVKEMFKTEKRLLILESPIYIFGDIHGSYNDLLYFEQAFWRLGPAIAPSSFLFLGDYVDRGTSSLAVVGHLFSCKILAQDKFFLLRGNHEDRCTNKTYGFFDECKTVFGRRGRDVYEAINSCFDVMPLAAVVDKKLFCVHGGIPECILEPPYLGAINSIDVNLPSPRDDPIASELLWNDPNYQSSSGDDYEPNGARGIGKLFNLTVVCNFLEQFNMSFVIRAHQSVEPGFDVRFGQQLITVYSSSETKSSSKTRAACILAADDKIRLIRFFTSSVQELLGKQDEDFDSEADD